VLFGPRLVDCQMTTFLLIRHALCDPVGRSIAGRRADVHLNETGIQQADRLADRMNGLKLAGLYSSPLDRAVETARPIAIRHALEVETVDGLNEIDFGDWTGLTLEELDQHPAWRTFNSFRSGCRIPGGENMAEVLARTLRELDRLTQLHPGANTLVAVISHGDVLRLLIAHALGMPVDLMHRMELSPASLTILEAESHGPRVLLLNSTEGWPRSFPTRTPG
jgi:probable phosphomutase (TIGR03848 family)